MTEKKKTEKSKVAAVECAAYSADALDMALDSAISAAGGWPEKIRGAGKVLLKPNLLTARPPEHAVTTHPEFLRAAIRALRKAGVEKISVGDSPAGSHPWNKLWEVTGTASAAAAEGAELLPFENIKRVELPSGETMPILKELEDFDAVVSLPKLKTHILTKITAAVKNSYGLIPGKAKSMFHGKYQSPAAMGRFIAKSFGPVKPDFVLMDGVECMEGQGPANGRPFALGLVFAGADAVAVDSAACRVYGYAPSDIPLLETAAAVGHGVADLDMIDLTGGGWDVAASKRPKRSTSDFLHRIPPGMFHVLTLILACRPRISRKKCVKCGICAKVCSQDAISQDAAGNYKVDWRKCVLCMCCIESCPERAIELRSLWTRWMK